MNNDVERVYQFVRDTVNKALESFIGMPDIKAAQKALEEHLRDMYEDLGLKRSDVKITWISDREYKVDVTFPPLRALGGINDPGEK